MARTLEELMSQAEDAVDAVDAHIALGLLDNDTVVFVDVRDRHEREQHGAIPGSVHAPRGMLELHIDPAGPAHNPVFTGAGSYVFYCAAGARSLLAAHRASEMGVGDCGYLVGGLPAWINAGGRLER